jgi:plastocyanin
MKRSLVAIVLAGTLALLAACGPSAPPSAGRTTGPATAAPTAAGKGCRQVTMYTSFDPSTCTIAAGAMVTFVNQSENVLMIFLGTNEKFQANPDGPAALGAPGGVPVYPLDSYGVTFPTAGTFAITATCEIPMPNMNMTVTVTGS